MLSDSSSPSYGTYGDEDDQFQKEGRRRLAESIRQRPSESLPILIEGQDDVGALIKYDLEQIFARAHECEGKYKAMGGIEGISKSLNVNLTKGIDSSSVPKREAVFGKNALPEEAPITFWQIYSAAWSDSVIQLLTGAAIISLILGLTVPEPGETHVNYKTGWIEGFAIIVSVIIVTSVSSINDYKKELKFRKLTEENSAQPIRVIRDGKEKVIDVEEIVVGEVVSLSPGLVVPVDGFYIRGMSVVIDESSVTGENDPKKKNAEHPVILTGTVVATAEDAFMLAGAVGENSFGGKLLLESRQEGPPRLTPMQNRLDELSELIGRFGLSVAILLFTILSIIELFRFIQKDSSANMRHFLDYFLLCVAIVVVAVPEGLPLAVTISLAYSQNKMHDDNNQVRRLRACETMGNATQICSDKTGTLTQNLMSVVQGYISMNKFSVTKPGDVPDPITLPKASEKANELLLEGIAINSSSEKVLKTIDKEGKTIPPTWQWATDKGNKTDNALLDFVDRSLTTSFKSTPNILPHQKLRESCRERGFTIFPFTSDRKRMSVVVVAKDGRLLHHVKGGSDRILPLCDRYLSAEGKEETLNDAMKETILSQVKSFADSANRTIGIAYTYLSSGSELPTEEPTESLVWLGLLGIQDPLRSEVAEAVRKCQMAGVTVRMCTGDNLDTAVAISRQCGIYNRFRGDIAMTGSEFRNLVYASYDDEARMAKFWPILDRMVVMARSQPLDKQLLVLMLMTRGDVVAVTGDGTNDAPALRLANVGFVMRSGTDIAVKSADIVLLDDNFRSVQRAVVWGRCVNDNIRKFLQLQLTVNLVSVGLTFIGCILANGASSPLTTVQLLWVNLIMDTLAALALATEEPSEECLKRGPVPSQAPLITRRMMCTTCVVTLYQLCLSLSVQQYGNVWFNAGPFGGILHRTIVFNVFVLSTLFHMFNSRKLYEELNPFEGIISRSRSFIAVLLFCISFQVVAVETFGDFMQVTSLSLTQWIGCILLSGLTLLFGILSRFIPIQEKEYPKEFNAENVDEDAKKMLIKLSEDVGKAQKDSSSLLSAQRLRTQALWRKARESHLRGSVMVNAFRKARTDRDMHDSLSRDVYTKLNALK